MDLFPVPEVRTDDQRYGDIERARVNSNTALESEGTPPYDSPSSGSSSSQQSVHVQQYTTGHRDVQNTPYSSSQPSCAVHRVGGYAVIENSKLTSALVGATFVQPSTVEYQGNKSLVFVFAVSSHLPCTRYYITDIIILQGSRG